MHTLCEALVQLIIKFCTSAIIHDFKFIKHKFINLNLVFLKNTNKHIYNIIKKYYHTNVLNYYNYKIFLNYSILQMNMLYQLLQLYQKHFLHHTRL